MTRLRSIWLAEHNEDGTHLTSATDNNLTPVGAIVAWPVAAAPTYWALCDGQQLSRVKYKSLFDVIGTTYGVGDGSTTFNVPDLQQKFILGLASAGTGSSLAGTGGAIDHTHDDGSYAVASHTHGAGSYSAAAHTHSVDPPNTTSTSTSISHMHSFSDTSSTASNGANQVSVQGGGTTIVSAPGHTHTVSGTTGSGGGSHTHNVNIASFSSGSASPSVSGTSGSTAPGVTGTSGTGNPPFMAMPFIIHTGVDV